MKKIIELPFDINERMKKLDLLLKEYDSATVCMDKQGNFIAEVEDKGSKLETHPTTGLPILLD